MRTRRTTSAGMAFLATTPRVRGGTDGGTGASAPVEREAPG